MSCSWKRPSRPNTPRTNPLKEAGTCGAAVLTMARADCPGARTDSSGVPSAAETTDAVPLTGNNELPGSGVPTVSPSLCRAEDTWATSAGVGPYCAAYCAAVRYCRYSGDPGVDTAATAWERPAGVGPGRTTSRSSTWRAGGAPYWVEPAGTCGTACGRTIRPGGAAELARAGVSAPTV